MFHIYVKITKSGSNYMIIDDTALTYDYVHDLEEKYNPNDIQNFAPSFPRFIEYLDKREHFFDEYTFLTSVPSLQDLPSLYPELFI